MTSTFSRCFKLRSSNLAFSIRYRREIFQNLQSHLLTFLRVKLDTNHVASSDSTDERFAVMSTRDCSTRLAWNDVEDK